MANVTDSNSWRLDLVADVSSLPRHPLAIPTSAAQARAGALRTAHLLGADQLSTALGHLFDGARDQIVWRIVDSVAGNSSDQGARYVPHRSAACYGGGEPREHATASATDGAWLVIVDMMRMSSIRPSGCARVGRDIVAIAASVARRLRVRRQG